MSPAAASPIRRAFRLAVLFNSLLIGAELFAGWHWNSLALISDAWHNLSDVFALLLAWSAAWLATRKRSTHYSFGLQRSTILASFVSAILLVGAVGWIGWEALTRLQNPPPAHGLAIFVVAGLAVVVNGLCTWLFHSDQKTDANIRASYLHMLADTLLSGAVMLAGIGIYLTGWLWLDPAISLLAATFILIMAGQLLRESTELSVDAVPHHINPQAVEHFLREQPGVRGVHDLHIWPLSTSQVAMTVHLLMNPLPSSDRFLYDLRDQLEQHFGVHHPTIQIESGDLDEPCRHEHPDHI